MSRLAWWLLIVLAVPVLAFAHGGIDAAKRSVEASMLVTGEIAVNPDGSVYGYSLDHRDKLPPAVVNLIGQTLTGWKFTPVDVNGKPELAKAFMSLRVVARQLDPKHDAISIESAAFGAETAKYHTPDACADRACMTYIKRSPPGYPPDLIRNLVSGTVYLAIEVDRQGKVAQVAVEKVDLRRLADETTLDRWRRELGEASMTAARHWTFSVPLTGPEAAKDHWVTTVPVNFNIESPGGGKSIGAVAYGQWDVYVPGPVQSISWVAAQRSQTASKAAADAVPDNGLPFIPDTRFVLLTPLGGNGTAKLSPEASPGQG